MEVTSTAPRQGRVVSSRYMDATASSRAAAAIVSVGKRSTATAQEKTAKISTSVRRSIKIKAADLSKKLPPLEAPAAKQQTVTSHISGSQSVSAMLGKSSRPPVQTSFDNKATTALELDIASQLYAWIYMRHTLSESSNSAAADFQEKYVARVNELKAEDKALEDNRIRFDAERETQLLDDLSSQHLLSVVLSLIRTFVHSQERCQLAIVNASRLQGTDWEAICTVQSIMPDLDQLTVESRELRESTAALLCKVPPESLLASTLEDILSVLDMRLENLGLSKTLLATILDNAKNSQHLDSLRVLVEVEDLDDPDI